MNNRSHRRHCIILGVTLSVILVFLLISMSRVRAQSGSTIQLAVDTANTNQDGLLTIFGGARLGGQIGLPVAAGDLNGDGKADLVFCEMYATTGTGVAQNNGQVNIYLSDGRDSGIVDAAQHPANISTVAGRSAGDLLGSAVAIGDVNGDGFGDVVVTASLNDGPDGSRFNAGAVYVIPGSSSFNFHSELSATGGGTPPDGISVIYGAQVNGRLGIWVETGDVDGDGIPDIVVGADQLNSDDGTRQHIGGAYIIFGSKNLPQVIDLASPPPGVRITKILGVSPGDHWGAALAVGDLNGDGISDVVISAALDRDSASYVTPADQSDGEAEAAASDGGLRPGCGEVYILYGSKNWPSEVDLTSPPANSTRLIGAHTGDVFGSQLFTADLNGDGKRDLIVGAIQADSPDAHGRTGAVYVVYGSSDPTTLEGITIDMLNPSASGRQISVVYGENNLDCAGDSVRAYDINNDGMAELFIGSPDNDVTVDGVDRDDAGTTDIIFGRSDFLPPVVKLYDLPDGFNVYRLAGAHGIDQGLDGGDEFSYRLAGADIDGDGYVDYVANAMEGDGNNNSLVNAGNVYIFSGKKLSAKLGFLQTQASAPVLNSAILSDSTGQTVQQAEAGQGGLVITVVGTGFASSFQLLVNGSPVVSSPPVDQPLPGMTEQLIRLDQNTSVRNSVGPLVVTAQNLNPNSPVSNQITAGTLTGPKIASITPKLKPSGTLILQISGSGFQSGFTALVTNQSGTSVPVKVSNVISSSAIKVKIGGQSFGSGTVLHVLVQNAAGIQSNSVDVTLP